MRQEAIRRCSRGLKIMREKDLCEKYMGKFPVISISLKGVGGLNYKDK